MDAKTLTNLSGAAAVGMALAVWYTHGGDWAEVEIGMLGAGMGAAIKYVVSWVDQFRPADD